MLEPIKCEIKFAADKQVFHIIELKTGDNKLVSYGRVFPIEGLKKFMRRFEKSHGVEIVNKRLFVREVKAYVKERNRLIAEFFAVQSQI